MRTPPARFEMGNGRRFFGRVPAGEELITFLERFCGENAVRTAVFSLFGQLSAYACGTYDPRQRVYVTRADRVAVDVLSCYGSITVKDGRPFVHATAVLCDPKGEVFGGRLFPDTIAWAVEIDLQELLGEARERRYDEETGLFLL